ncbi:MAG TPA: aromatic aminobenezylarsenical efflux permease ArsG family transporter [Phycisphaerae bacterium]|nr:aromatic aminobenezylarsenical efflux permease ArsG family transporter [Phycisphaerae bacterium]
MNALALGAAWALWLGILTSISPCPLATNIAAISFIGKRVGSTRHVLLSGLCYTLGRALTYLGIGVLVAAGLLSIPGASNFLQQFVNKLLGPLLILVGMFLLDLISLPIRGTLAGERTRRLAEKGGVAGAGLLGILFALSFCPISAAIFFGSLIPLSLKHESSVVLPCLYGIGTALPVAAFAVLIAFGTRRVGRAFDRLTQIERWARRATGVVFILVGIYYCLTYIFEVFT